MFSEIPDVFELRGTMRLKAGDPLIDLLQCVRQGQRLPDAIWNAFQEHCASNTTSGKADERFKLPRFRRGYRLRREDLGRPDWDQPVEDLDLRACVSTVRTAGSGQCRLEGVAVG